MLPLHLAPSVLVTFMVLLAVVPLAIVWFDQRRAGMASDRLERLREGVRLRQVLNSRAAAEGKARDLVRPGV